jgi:signal transduction histidine kinase/CheY-like chemotaxis protein
MSVRQVANRIMPEFASELRVSLKPFILLVLLPGTYLALEAWSLPGSSDLLNLSLLLVVVSVVAWGLDEWNTLVGRWFLICWLTLLVVLARAWFEVPGILVLSVASTALAAPLIGLQAAPLVATGQTLLLGGLAAAGVGGAPGYETAMALAVIWLIVGVVVAAYHPILRLSHWSWDYYHRALVLLEEARGRQAELKRALADLTYANRQLALANEKLAAARLLAEQAQRTKAAFVANVSHEFRTPLNMIIGLIDLVTEAPEVYGPRLPAALHKDLEIVRRNCEHLASMINDVLDLSQVEAGRLALHKEWVDWREVIERALSIVRPLLAKKGIALYLSIPEDLPQLYCDRTRLRQVILNLLSNAARFTDEGSITVSARLESQYIVISVRDTGPGISADDASRIFEPFQQGSFQQRRDQGGSGLGLCISKQFVELHGGKMWLQSETGRGSTFSFRIPVSSPTDPTTGAYRWIAGDWEERPTHAEPPDVRLERRMLVCDETGELLPVLARYAERTEFVAVPDVSAAAREMRSCPAQAVLLNAADNERLLSLAERASAAIPDTPILGCSVPARTQPALLAGAAAYLLKPLRRADLAAVLRRVDLGEGRVLVVDDDRDALQLLTRMILAYDETLEVRAVTSAAEALDQLRLNAPDLMLLDILMPDMDGWGVLRVMRGDDRWRDIPVVVISAQDVQDQPLTSRTFLATMGRGLSVSKLLSCSRSVSTLLMQPD